jgi:hypothetical protein
MNADTCLTLAMFFIRVYRRSSAAPSSGVSISCRRNFIVLQIELSF